MTITIQIQDGGAAAVSQSSGDNNAAMTPGAANAADGGAPRHSAGTDESADAAGGDTTDIGGPPQWLSEAIGDKTGNGATASATGSEGGGESQDGGSGPSF